MLPMLLFHSRVTPIFMGRSSAGRFPTPVDPSFILIAPPSWPPQARGVIARLATETSHTEELLWDPQECVAAPETTNSKYFTCAFILSQAHGDTRGYSPPYLSFWDHPSGGCCNEMICPELPVPANTNADFRGIAAA